MAEEYDFKIMADEVSGALATGYDDLDIDRALFSAYPDMVVGKENFTPQGEYIPGSAYQAFYQGMARKIRPKGDMRFFRNLGRDWVRGATFGASDKLGALLISMTNDVPYDEALRSIRESESEYKKLYPTESASAEVGGAVTSPVTFGVAMGVNNLLTRLPVVGQFLKPQVAQPMKNLGREMIKSSPIAGIESGLYTAGTSDTMGEFIERAPRDVLTAMAAGPMLTPPMYAATEGAKAGVRRLIGPGQPPPPGASGEGIPAPRSDDQRGIGVIAQAQLESGGDRATTQAELQRLRDIDPSLEAEATFMDVGGSQQLPATMGALMYPGQARDLGMRNIMPFLETQVERLKGFTNRTLLKAPNFAEFVQKLDSKRQGAGRIYDNIFKRRERISPDYKTKVEVDGVEEEISLSQILDAERPSVQQALKRASQIAAERRTMLPQPDADGFDGEFLHFVKMGYDDVISDYGETGLRGVIRRDAIANLKALVKVLDEKLPGYKKARAKYADASAQNRAIIDGYNDIKRRTTASPEALPEMLAFRFDELSASEKDAYRAGAARYLEEFISSDLDAQSLTNKARQLSKEGMVNKIESIFGKDAASKFKTYMDESANMFQRRVQALPTTNSLTASRGEAQKMFQMDAGEATGRIPLSRGELLEATMRQGANDRLRQLERQAASAAAPRLTRPGPQNVMQTQQDVDRFRRAVLFQQALDNLRVGTIPGLLGPTSESVRNFGESMIR